MREDLQRRIERKRQEVEGFKRQAELGEAYINALTEALRMVPREGTVLSESNGNSGLRKGSMPAAAHQALRRVGHPVHVKDLLELIGKKPTRLNYSSLSSSLTAYTRKGEVFSKPAPNTFGLLEWGDMPATDQSQPETDI